VTVTLSRLERAERPHVLDLMRAVNGRAMSEHEFEWFLDRNPVHPGIVSGAKEGGRLNGVLAMVFARAVTGGGECRIAFPVQAVTHPEVRRQGIFSGLELQNEAHAVDAGTALAIAFPNVTRSTFVGRLGWTELHAMRLWARPLRPLRALRRTGGGSLRAPVGDELQEFEDAHERAWRAARPRWGSCVVRDAAYLNWRYLESPRDYRAFGDNGAYAVVRHLVHKGVSVAAICDLVGPPAAQRRLLRRCLREASGGADAAITVPAPDQRAPYLALGFVPTPMRIRVVGKALQPETELARDWYFSLGDTDFI
jgi:hypothetical protein